MVSKSVALAFSQLLVKKRCWCASKVGVDGRPFSGQPLLCNRIVAQAKLSRQ